MKEFGRIPLLIIIGTLAVVIVIMLSTRHSRVPMPSSDNFCKVDMGEAHEILIVAPHNDDEVLGPGGTVQNCLAEGTNVRVVMMTNGDGQWRGPFVSSKKNEIQLGYRRQRETIKALANLGIPEKNVIFLGYPDRGLNVLWNSSWTCDNLYRSKRTGEDHTEYTDSYQPGAPYCGISVVQDLEKILKDNVPDIIYFPHPQDIHPDHWATNAFVTYALEKLRTENPTDEKLKKLREFTYLVHFWRWPLPRGKHLNDSLLPPKELVELGTQWVKNDLAPDVTENKLKSILQYKSQMEFMPRYLESFARTDELFGILPPLRLNISSTLSNYQSAPELLSGNESETSPDTTPFLTYLDPIHRSILSEIRRLNDIKSVDISGDERFLIITVDCLNKIKDSTNIMIHIKPLLPSGGNNSFMFELKEGKLLLNNEDFSNDSQFSFKVVDESFKLKVPMSFLGNPPKIILGAELLRKDISFSKSAYRTIQLN